MKQSAALDGVRVLDLTSVAFGPLCTQNLGDMGADVIKIEAPPGDTTRHTGPTRSPAMAAVFLNVNRNKRSVVLDLKQASARAALWQLVAGADVLVHSIRPQAMARLGFDGEAVLARNPRLIYCALTGFGAAGPYAGQPAYDDVIQGLSGATDLMARLLGEPRYFPSILADKVCALVATYAITTALYARERSGQGQVLEVPMFEAMTAFNLAEHLFGHAFEPPEGELGYSRTLAPWRRPYPTADGHLCMLAYTDAQWQRFWTEAGRVELASDPRFASMAARSNNIDELYRLAGECMATRSTENWRERLQALAIPCAPVHTLEDLAGDPHLQAVDFFQQVEHPSEGRMRMTAFPVHFSATPAGLRRLQPRLGEHSVEVLRAAGVDAATLAAMLASGATVQHDEAAQPDAAPEPP